MSADYPRRPASGADAVALTGAFRRAATVLAATLLGVALTANLGAWQLRRAAQKTALQEALASRAGLPPVPQADLARSAVAAEAQHYRSVHLLGRWLADRTVYLDNRQMRGRVGFYVVTPLQLDRNPGAAPADEPPAVLVQRGWVPRDQLDRTSLPRVPTPAGRVDIEGRIAPPPSRLYQLGDPSGGMIRQNLDLAGFAAETGLRLAPLSVQQSSSARGTETANAAAAEAATDPSDGLLRDWPPPAIDVQKHYGYAFQWFALSALMTGLYVWFQLVRPRLQRSV